MVSKYDALGAFLRQQTAREVPMTFADIERATGVLLPGKSQHSRAWWSNNPANNVMTTVWLDAGFETAKVDMKAKTVVFVRKAAAPSQGIAAYMTGMADEAVEYKDASSQEKPPTRHPAWGAMKGTFEIDPTWDLTKPTMSDEELAEWEAGLDRKADRIEAGMKGMSENARDHEAKEGERLPDHPLFGCLKGTFWIDPEWDWTKPALDPEELAEWEASIDRKFASLARDLSKK